MIFFIWISIFFCIVLCFEVSFSIINFFELVFLVDFQKTLKLANILPLIWHIDTWLDRHGCANIWAIQYSRLVSKDSKNKSKLPVLEREHPSFWGKHDVCVEWQKLSNVSLTIFSFDSILVGYMAMAKAAVILNLSLFSLKSCVFSKSQFLIPTQDCNKMLL